MKLKLEEVLWEVTNKCNKNCSYCGSRHILNKMTELSFGDKLKVVTRLVEHGVKEVTLTGGEPGMLDVAELNTLVGELTKGGVKVKVVTNGKLLELEDLNIFEFTAIGVSVNTAEDIEEVCHKRETDNHYASRFDTHKGLVMITNFGTHNIFLFNKLAEFARERFRAWQVQLTMGENTLPKEGIAYLRQQLSEAKKKNKMIVEADNLQLRHDCTAGFRSCGITCTGDVVACLSERSYGDQGKVYGNIASTNTLKDVWERGFDDCRFECRKCCRDHIEYPEESTEQDNNKLPIRGLPPPFTVEPIYGVTVPPPITVSPNIVTVYGVTSPERSVPVRPFGPMMYGVFNQQVIAYSVYDVNTSDYRSWTTGDSVVLGGIQVTSGETTPVTGESDEEHVKKVTQDFLKKHKKVKKPTQKSDEGYRSDGDLGNVRFVYGVVDMTDLDPQGNSWMSD